MKWTPQRTMGDPKLLPNSTNKRSFKLNQIIILHVYVSRQQTSNVSETFKYPREISDHTRLL